MRRKHFHHTVSNQVDGAHHCLVFSRSSRHESVCTRRKNVHTFPRTINRDTYVHARGFAYRRELGAGRFWTRHKGLRCTVVPRHSPRDDRACHRRRHGEEAPMGPSPFGINCSAPRSRVRGRGFAFIKDIFDVEDVLTAFRRKPECHRVDDHFFTYYCRYRGIPLHPIKKSRSYIVPETDVFVDKLRDESRALHVKRCTDAFSGGTHVQ